MSEQVDLAGIQQEHRRWCDKNFPEEDLMQATLGVCEEAGELAHSVLKLRQGIRGDAIQHRLDAADALGDIFIFALSVADYLDVDMEEVINRTWAKVHQRDWIKDKVSGGQPDLPNDVAWDEASLD